MSEALLLEFAAVSADHYRAANIELGIDPVTGAGDWPPGLLDHIAVMTTTGNLMVFEVWDSRQSHAEFMTTRLAAALARAGVPAPARVDWFEVLGQHTRPLAGAG